VVNAANPWEERRPVTGFDNRDWHSFVLAIPGVGRSAQLYCDGQHVLDLLQPITARQRAQISEQEKERHGSVQQLVPETPGADDYAFLESRHPGQVLEIDRFSYSQEPPSTPRLSLPVLLDLDWELGGTRMTENGFTRYQGNPLLAKSDLPAPAGTSTGAFHVQVFQAGGGFVMYLCGRNQLSLQTGMNSFSIYRSVSSDGINWSLEPRTPVLEPGHADGWDGGSLGKAVVLKEAASTEFGMVDMCRGCDRDARAMPSPAMTSTGAGRRWVCTSLVASRPTSASPSSPVSVITNTSFQSRW